MFYVWDMPHIIEKIFKKLEHENDGLIFTEDLCPYYPGTCKSIYKWKPPHLNSIDFKLLKAPQEIKTLVQPHPHVFELYT
jgi:hypothetical protein